MKGFSPRNLKYMRRFAEVWAGEEFVQQVAAQLPWFHNCVLLDKVAGTWRAYVVRSGRHPSRMEPGDFGPLRSRVISTGSQGKAITNFNRALPPPQSDLAQEVTKDPYNFDFLMRRGRSARDATWNRGLLGNICASFCLSWK